jgi:enterochelin esterase family protein
LIATPARSQIIIEEIHSPALEGNPLGDPATRRVPLYLPPGYDPGQRYPSVYLLSAFGQRGLRLLNDDLWEENIQQRLDRLIAEGQLRPLIVIMPDASTRYGGSQYVNSSATGRYADHILELVAVIDGKYPTLPDAAHRAVAGHSSGGFAATRFGMLHPEIFGLVADHSGDKYFEMVFQPEFGEFLRYYERVSDEGLQLLMQDPGEVLRRGGAHIALNILAMAACFSPNPDSPNGFDLPFDLHSGELRPEVWSRWLAFDPVRILDDHLDALRSLRLLYFDCGRFDEYNLLYGARVFAQRLQQHQIPFRYEEFEGGHRNTKFRFDVSLAAISQAMP